uniref:Metalloendopeptidase n=1 Tax=Clytia hemisphaerica TaxID=252671 RepID=A0A7M5V4G7_9CNID
MTVAEVLVMKDNWIRKLRFLICTLLIKVLLISCDVAGKRRLAPLPRFGDRLWTDRIIPYVIHPNVPDKALIESTIEYFNNLSCVQWIPKKSEHEQYVTFQPSTTCSSLIGRNQNGNHQSIFIGQECSYRPIILHEMYHVMGFQHEMKRFDRNDNIEVLWENILPGFERYFKKLLPEKTLFPDYPYDISSILHYGSFAYSKYSSLPTTLQSNGMRIRPIKERSLTQMDIQKLNDLYKCKDTQKEGWSSWSNYSRCNADCFKTRFKFFTGTNYGTDPK